MSRTSAVLITFLSLALASTAHALPQRYRYSVQSLTRANPTGTPGFETDGNEVGMNLSNVKGYRVSVCAENGQTLSGGGNLRVWLYHIDAQLWMRNPLLDLPVTIAGAQCQVFPDVITGIQTLGHRVLFAADTITVSGGTTVTVRLDGELLP